MFDMLFASHQGSWAFVPILFLIAYSLYRAGKNTGGRILHIILYLFYLIMIVTGVGLLIEYNFMAMYIVKGILAILLIGFIEMTLAKTRRGEKTAVVFTLVVITLILVVLLGFGVISF
ncbi:putative membrane protein SirB2 [Geomicrobium halophilum]|uniref:UPF0344 protein HNR44_000462 n=1 Tax=Geomicrobium halophilum TaxID=549000 RepID=A0A841PW61_9BACL|nr:DUF1516 family protein [Geomicrobium halophilum]MBB6448513.1 putative membrane protein SirB2 [Geomicrobium halophilum]